MVFTHSQQPFPEPLPGEYRYLLADGTLFPEGARWFYDNETVDAPHWAIADGQYDALSGMGPVLIPLPTDTGLARLWSSRHERLQRAVILHSSYPIAEMAGWLRARSQVRLPDGRVVWFRIGDAAVLKRMIHHAGHVPANFWQGVRAFSVCRTTDFSHCEVETDANANMAITSDRVEPLFHFSGMLSDKLGPTTPNQHRDVL